MSYKIGVIGCGKMAYAILNSLINNLSIPIDKILVNDINYNSAQLFAQDFGAITGKANFVIANSDIVLLAVKPQQIIEVVTDNLSSFKDEHIIISIAAGIKIDEISNLLNNKSAIVRVMPNIPVLVGQGVVALAVGNYVNDEKLNIVQNLLSYLGITYLVDEGYIDAITAISGSGPAYFFLIIEALINAGILIGLDNNFSKDIVIQTLKGSMAMLEDTNKHPAVLREEVCSPAGTTIAAVKKLEEHGIRNAIFEAVNAAYLRAQELSNK
ncbi:MAG: pyrroline-5-carboxylate reductase [Syntrophomonadaceae bacterium]|nr:pyrroline-5-carboxylate reductase [Syntrophomonadaceae bacterium]